MPEVLHTCEMVVQFSTHVAINDAAIQSWADGLSTSDLLELTSPKAFDKELHFVDDKIPELTAQYLLVVDSLNFCFWPSIGLEYEHLSKGLKARVEADPSCISAESLCSMTTERVSAFFLLPSPNHIVPLADERARLLREVGQGLLDSYQGQAANIIRAAGGSAQKLLSIITSSFPGFRDHAIYKGKQVFLYKRAQIYIADLYGAFEGTSLGAFSDMDSITMFADYRVPVVLRKMGILSYEAALSQTIEQHEEVASGSNEEVEIRAATIIAVERMRLALMNKHPGRSDKLLSIHLDWHLWTVGERTREEDRHHRTLTIYY
jgi:hypothetical protein